MSDDEKITKTVDRFSTDVVKAMGTAAGNKMPPPFLALVFLRCFAVVMETEGYSIRQVRDILILAVDDVLRIEQELPGVGSEGYLVKPENKPRKRKKKGNK